MSKLSYNLVTYLKNFVTDERRALFEEKIEQRTKHLTIVLENVFQARNISASIRSADCFGIQDVHIIENDNLFEDNTEVSMGATKWINLKHYNEKAHNTVDAIKKLKEEGYQIVAATPHQTDVDLYDLDVVNNKVALIFGAEVLGCSEQALELADKRMKIPMYGFTESFNISVAVSLCLQHLTYKLRAAAFDYRMTDANKNKVLLQWLRKSIKSSAKIEKQFLEKYDKK